MSPGLRGNLGRVVLYNRLIVQKKWGTHHCQSELLVLLVLWRVGMLEKGIGVKA